MENKLEKIQLDAYKPLRELVTDNIRHAILCGSFPPGMRLMELQLASEIGVSRTPVREAIRALELEGLVVMIPRRGAYVANISIKDINEVYEVRTALEVLAAGLASERINDEELEEMERILVAMTPLTPEHDMEALVANDTKFHDIIYNASRNGRLISIVNNLREQINSIRGGSMGYPGRLAAMMDEHRAIVDAIAQRDEDAAQQAVRTHMENAERTLLRKIEENSLADEAKLAKEKAKENENG